MVSSVIAPPVAIVGLAVGPDKTRAVASPDVAADPTPEPVRETPVGAMVLEGSIIPEGPKVTVVPSICVVTSVLRAPEPMPYVVPSMMAWEESMLKVNPPIVVTTYADAVIMAGAYVVAAKATPLLPKVTV